MSDIKDIQQLIDSFVAYRNVLAPLQESLHNLSETYRAIRDDLDSLNKSFSASSSDKLGQIHAMLSSQAKSGVELTKKMDEYAQAGDEYSHAVKEMTERFDEVAGCVESIWDMDRRAEAAISKLEEILSEKRASYNLKDLQKSLDSYNKNVEKISEFINKDIASVLQQNAEKIESIQKQNNTLAEVVGEQGKAVAELTATFAQTSLLLRKTVESGSVNEEYLFDAFDRWAADRKVKIKRK